MMEVFSWDETAIIGSGSLWVSLSNVYGNQVGLINRVGPGAYRTFTVNQVGVGGCQVQSVPGFPSTLYAIGIGTNAISKSTDGGATWSTTGLTVPPGGLGNQPGDCCLDDQDPNNLYVATGSGLWKSTDGGATWILLYQDTTGFGGRFIRKVNGRIWAGTGGFPSVVMFSDDDGASWTTTIPNSDLIHGFGWAIRGDPAHDMVQGGSSGWLYSTASPPGYQQAGTVPTARPVWMEENGATGTTLLMTQEPAIYRAPSPLGAYTPVLTDSRLPTGFFTVGKYLDYDPATSGAATTWYAIGSTSTGQLVVFISHDDGQTWSSETFQIPGLSTQPTFASIWVAS